MIEILEPILASTAAASASYFMRNTQMAVNFVRKMAKTDKEFERLLTESIRKSGWARLATDDDREKKKILEVARNKQWRSVEEGRVVYDLHFFNPKEYLNKERFGFLGMFLSPKPVAELKTQIQARFSIDNIYLADSLYQDWINSGVVQEESGQVKTQSEIIRRLCFSTQELLRFVGGVARISEIQDACSAGSLAHDAYFQNLLRFDDWCVDFEIRGWDPGWLSSLQSRLAGKPIPMDSFARDVLSVDNVKLGEAIVKKLISEHSKSDIRIGQDEQGAKYVQVGLPNEETYRAALDHLNKLKGDWDKQIQDVKNYQEKLGTYINKIHERDVKHRNQLQDAKRDFVITHDKRKVIKPLMDEFQLLPKEPSAPGEGTK